MKQRAIFVIAIVLLNAACQSSDQNQIRRAAGSPASGGKSRTTYAQALSDLATTRSGALENAGWSIQHVNTERGLVVAKKSNPLHSPRPSTTTLKSIPVFLVTSDSISAMGSEGEVISSVTGYWTGPR